MADHNMHDDHHHHHHEQDDAMLDPNEAEEVIDQDDDAAMDSGDDDDDNQIMQEIQLQNDSAAHFDHHKKSIFCVAQHPTRPDMVATGAGDDIAYVWDSTPPEGPVLPASYESDPQPRERNGQEILARLEEQDESVNAICFTLPKGDYVATATLAGKLNVYTTPTDSKPAKLIASAKEVDSVNWMTPCPHKDYPNTLALGADDGSVWIYTINASDPSSPLTIVQSFFLHQAPCTAGAWTPDGKLLATVAEDSSLFVWDPFGDAAAAGVTDPNGSQAVFGLSAADERFKVDGGLYSVAITMGGSLVAVGGAEGHIRIVGLPRLAAQPANGVAGAKGAGARAKAGGAKQSGTPGASSTGNAGGASTGQSGQILASLQAQSDGIETLDFSQPPLQYLAAGSVDGSIAVFDVAHSFAVRRHIKEAHANEEVPQAVTKVQFVKTALGTRNDRNWLLTSAGNDGVLRRWDVRGGTAAVGQGLSGEWRGHTGDQPDENGENGGGILDFVQGGGGKRVVTAGDDGVALVFDTA